MDQRTAEEFVNVLFGRGWVIIIDHVVRKETKKDDDGRTWWMIPVDKPRFFISYREIVAKRVMHNRGQGMDIHVIVYLKGRSPHFRGKNSVAIANPVSNLTDQLKFSFQATTPIGLKRKLTQIERAVRAKKDWKKKPNLCYYRAGC